MSSPAFLFEDTDGMFRQAWDFLGSGRTNGGLSSGVGLCMPLIKPSEQVVARKVCLPVCRSG